MQTQPITRSGITLFPYSQLTPVVALYGDHAGGWRLHTGEESRGFRGYASREFDTWTVHAFCPASGRKFHRRGYKTENGAVRALSRQAEWIEG